MYDKTPVYPHQQHLPWAHEPLKSIYVFQRLLTTILLVPLWAVYYAVVPRSFRPRPSWSITQIIVVKFTKRIYKVTEVAGVTWGTRDPTQEPSERSLKETRFDWVPPLPSEFCTGVVNDDQVPHQKVGTFIWPKLSPPSVHVRCLVNGGDRGSPERLYFQQNPSDDVHSVGPLFDPYDDMSVTTTPTSNYKLPKTGVHGEVLQSIGDATKNLDVEANAAVSPPHVIGLYLHGGGYCHMSAHENSGTSRIPRRLMKDNLFQEIHAVEYRLLQHAPVPGAIQDAAAVYTHLVTHRLGAFKGLDGKYHYPDSPIPHHTDAHMHRISADTVDPVYSTPANSVAAAHRPRIILIGDSAGGNLVLALARWIRDEGVLPVPDGMILLSPSCDPSHTLPQVPASRRLRPHADTDYLLDTPEPRALLSRTFLGHHPNEMVYSPYISPASEWVLSVFHGKEGMVDLEPLGADNDSRDYRDEGIKTYDCAVNGVAMCPIGRFTTKNPYIRVPPGMGLFTDFPRVLVVAGDAERLEREVAALERALVHDGVRARMVWAKDAVHDILIMAKWDERVREGVWREIGKWVCEVASE